MATDRSFQAMLNEHLDLDLIKDEVQKNDYLLSKVKKDNTWRGGTLPVPFKSAVASSIKFGGLSTDVAEDQYVRGEVSSYKEVWGSIKFQHTDLLQHGHEIKESSFLKILPDALEDFTARMRNCVSQNLLNGAALATATADGDASGNLTVDRPERFEIGQYVQVDDGDSSPANGYVRTINLDTGVISLFDARSGGSAVDLSAYTTAQAAVVYEDGAQANSFTSLKSQLLSAANGGDASIFGQTKTAYPILQSVNVDGSSASATNLLEKVFDAFTTSRVRGKGRPDTALMSYTNLSYIMKILETAKGAYHIAQTSPKVAAYNWTEIDRDWETREVVKASKTF